MIQSSVFKVNTQSSKGVKPFTRFSSTLYRKLSKIEGGSHFDEEIRVRIKPWELSPRTLETP